MENQRRYFYNSNCRDVYYFVMILVLLNSYLKVYMMIATLFKHTVETYSLLLLYSFLHINLSIQKQNNRKLFKNLKKNDLFLPLPATRGNGIVNKIT